MVLWALVWEGSGGFVFHSEEVPKRSWRQAEKLAFDPENMGSNGNVSKKRVASPNFHSRHIIAPMRRIEWRVSSPGQCKWAGIVLLVTEGQVQGRIMLDNMLRSEVPWCCGFSRSCQPIHCKQTASRKRQAHNKDLVLRSDWMMSSVSFVWRDMRENTQGLLSVNVHVCVPTHL